MVIIPPSRAEPSQAHFNEFNNEWEQFVGSVEQVERVTRVEVGVVASEALSMCLSLIVQFLLSHPFPAAATSHGVSVVLMVDITPAHVNEPRVSEAIFSICHVLMENLTVDQKAIVLRAAVEGVPYPPQFQERVELFVSRAWRFLRSSSR
jgi:hypothetical protein